MAHQLKSWRNIKEGVYPTKSWLSVQSQGSETLSNVALLRCQVIVHSPPIWKLRQDCWQWLLHRLRESWPFRKSPADWGRWKNNSELCFLQCWRPQVVRTRLSWLHLQLYLTAHKTVTPKAYGFIAANSYLDTYLWFMTYLGQNTIPVLCFTFR